MILKEHLSDEAGFADLLNYAHIIADGIILNKDGSFLTAYKFRGPDINSASTEELDALTANFNRMITFLEDGWMLHVDEVRIPSVTYSAAGAFPCKVAAMIDAERRSHYASVSAHYENMQFLTFIWKFPQSIVRTTRHWFVEGEGEHDDSQNFNKLLQFFINTVERCVNIISAQITLESLNSQELINFLNTCITSAFTPIAIPNVHNSANFPAFVSTNSSANPNSTDDEKSAVTPQKKASEMGCVMRSDAGGEYKGYIFIDTLLARHNVVGGYIPRVGEKNIIVLSLVGYLNSDTIPGLLEEMVTYPIVYRWSNRFLPLSEPTAEREIKRHQKNWNNKVKGLFGTVKEAVFGGAANKINADALQMSQEATAALTMNSNHSTRFGYWTSALLLMHEDLLCIEQASKVLTKYLEQAGFICIKEDVNAFDAWLGTIPGHGSCNMRRLFINSINLAHLLPLHTIWAGNTFSSTASLLSPNSPPIFYAATTGRTPFRFHLDVADVGHQIVLGPTGAGKSTYLGFLIAQFLRYQGAQIFVFDKDYSHQALTIALGGNHYDIGNGDELSFCPLADLATASKKIAAEQFIENLVLLQNVVITPGIRSAIHAAIESLAEDAHLNSRTITVLRSIVQHDAVREALHYYTIDGQIKLLDATSDSLKDGYLQTFEMGWLLAQKPEIYLPVLMYIFSQIEWRLEEARGKKPTIIVLEEAWLYIAHPVFANKLRDWLKTLRKKNARVIFATQSLTDLYDPETKALTAVTAAIMESCPTKVYLPNQKMEFETRALYKKIGLNERQIELISAIGIPKRHYYVVTPEGNRLIELGLDEKESLALAFIGLSKSSANDLLACCKKYGAEEWIEHWLQYCGVKP